MKAKAEPAKTILMIDDDKDMCQLLVNFLKRKSYEADQAFSGKEGLEKLAKQHYDVVLLDYRLGDTDGLQMMPKIKQKRPRAIIIVVTGYSDIKLAVQVIKGGAFDYITKPLMPEELLKTIQKALEEMA